MLTRHSFSSRSLSTTYTEVGKGETLIFLPGWGATSGTHEDTIAVLSHHYRVICLDLPGMGKENSPPKLWNFNDYADYVCNFLDQRSEEKVIISGHSFGAAIALYTASRSKKIKKVVLFDAAGLPIVYSRLLLYYKYIKELIFDLITPQNFFISVRCIRVFLSQWRNLPYKIRLALAVFNRKVAIDSSVFQKITVPVVVFWGDHDFVFTRGSAEEFAKKLKGEKVIWISGSHNWIIFEPQKLSPFLNLI